MNKTAKNALTHVLVNRCVHVLKYMFLIIIHIISMFVINICINVCLYVCVYNPALAGAAKWFLKMVIRLFLFLISVWELNWSTALQTFGLQLKKKLFS